MSVPQAAIPQEKQDYIDVTVRVRYAETDKMAVVYYANYPIYFEVGRAEYMRVKGFSYRDFEKMGYFLMVANLEARYFGSAVYDDLLTVRTRIKEVKSRRVTFHYEILRDGTVIVEGSTQHICVDSNKKTTVVIPSHLLDVLKDAGTQ